MTLPPVKIYKPSKFKALPFAPRIAFGSGDEAEFLVGEVNGMKASAPEERYVNALRQTKNVNGFEFRVALGAPRGMSGWKELDLLVDSLGVKHAIEIDTEFTHRDKGTSDVLHDAIVLNELRQLGYMVYPEVLHINGDRDLVDMKTALQTTRSQFE